MGAGAISTAADMALVEFESKIPVDEVIDAMYQVGSSLPLLSGKRPRRLAKQLLPAAETSKEIFGE